MQSRKRPPDFTLFLTVMMLLSLGVVMVFSASGYSSLVYYGDSFYFFKRQLLWSFIGLAALFVMMNYDYHQLRRWAGPFLVLAFILLLLVFIPGIGYSSHGAQRWIRVGPVTFAPAETVKLCLIIFTAYGLSRNREKIVNFTRGVFPYLLVMALAAGLVLLQPDLGTAISLAGIVFVMIFVAGARLAHLGVLALAGMTAVGVAIAAEPYRMQRFLAFMNPWADPQGSGFHIIQALYALGSGRLFGLGLGQSRQKFLYLPEQHTDFIFAIIGEELGFLGTSLVILLFLVFIWRGLKIAVASPDPFASLLAAGITAWVGVQAVINIGVVTGSLPITGITLPFISFGGTSLIFILAGVGILLNISRFTEKT